MVEEQAIDTRPWEHLESLLAAGDTVAIEAYVQSLAVAEAVRAVSRLGDDQRVRLMAVLPPRTAASIVGASPESEARHVMRILPPTLAARLLQELPSAQVVDIIAGLNDEIVQAILREMRPDAAADARHLAKYDPNEAGGLMITEFLSYPESYTAANVLDDMRDNADRYADFDVQYAYCVSAFGDLVGVLRLRDLVLVQRNKRLSDFMIRTPFSVRAHASLDELQQIFEERAFLGVPVVDDGGRLVGVVKRSDVEAALARRAGSDYLKSQGIVLGEELRTMPLRVRSSRRLAWLVLNIGLNVVAASVIALFQGTLEQVIALAVFLPIISDMSGCAGSQAVAVSMRELTLGMVRPHEIMRVLWKEVQVGIVNGAALGVIMALLTLAWKGNPWLGVVAGVALALNTLLAVCAGGTLPLILKRLGKDPALAAGLILTTITDMCGFLLVLGLATLVITHLT